MKEQQPSLKRILQPYLFISFAGLLAFAPVSFMLRALKNDIVALEYPINHFISQCIHNGELPYWFNTWGMGFPLQSNLTWGIFSTPQMLFSSLFNYNMYTLHIEFMFFVLLAGWSMFHLLHKYFVKDERVARLLAICYMLSGFMVGSTQWLLYITAASFIPLIISSLLKLLYTPSFKNVFQFSVVYFLMFTSVYAAFNIITTYSLALFILLWFLISKNEKRTKLITLRYIVLAGAFTMLLCFPCLYYTAELLKYMGRGDAIATDTAFFNSNYLHPSALSNMLLPFSSVKMSFPNTEGTMLNSYIGLFVLLLLPAAIWQALKEKSRHGLLILSAAILFLLISFGEITPIRNALNVLPGFSYFRNPAIFRLYFIISLILFLAVLFHNKSFSELFTFKARYTKGIHYTLWTLLVVCLLTFLLSIKYVNNLSFTSLRAFIKNISFGQTMLISSFIQSIILLALLLAAKMQKFRFIYLLLTADLIINTLVCTPFFSVSSYSLPAVNQILRPVPGFPLQHKTLDAVETTHYDEKGNAWNNINIFSKQVSSNEAYRGPLTLKSFYLQSADSFQPKKVLGKDLLFASEDSVSASIQLLLQKPAHIRASVNLTAPGTITVMQNNYPGWKAWYNNKQVEFTSKDKSGMTIAVPKGKGTIDFRYERKGIWISALLLHLITLCFLLWKGIYRVKRFVKSSSLS